MFYSLHAAIWPHSAIENRLVKKLNENKIETVYVSCGATFPSHCTSYSGRCVRLNSPQNIKNSVCRECMENAEILVRASGARHLKLRHYVSSNDEKKIDSIIKTVTKKNCHDIKYLGVNVSRATYYECLLEYKQMSLKFKDEAWMWYITYLRNSLQSLIGFSKILKAERPDILLFYSPQYGVNGVCAEYALKHGTKVYFVEGSSSNSERYKALRIWDWKIHGLVNPALSYWPSMKKQVRYGDVNRLLGHFQELFQANSFAVYSSPKKENFDIRKAFNIPTGAKILLATLSSFDEAYAAFVIKKFPRRKVFSRVYKNQFEWIKDTIEYIKKKQNTYLIIRVHPRDFPNKREIIKAQQAELWKIMLDNLPENIRVNWPEEEISLYNLLQDIDGLVTGWSATGLEALVMGIPLVTYDKNLPSFPPDIHFSGSTRKQYYKNLEKMLKIKKSFKIAKNAIRWLAFNFSVGTIQFEPLLKEESIYLKSPSIPKFLRNTINKIIKILKIKHEARGDFYSEQDTRRFLYLCKNKSKDLFENYIMSPCIQKANKNTVNVASKNLYKSLLDQLAKTSEK